MGKLNGTSLGDVQDPELRKTIRQAEHLGRQRWIVKPEWQPPVIHGMESAQALIDQHLMGRLWQLLADHKTLLEKTNFRVQQPGWLEAPFGSEPEDLVSEDGVALVTGVETTVLTYQLPDRHVGSFPRFGQNLDHATEFGTVLWTIRVNKKPVRSYYKFKLQRGSIIEPTPMAKPITLRGKDVLTVTAIGGVNPVKAFVRLPGWIIPVTSMTQDGSAIDYNVR